MLKFLKNLFKTYYRIDYIDKSGGVQTVITNSSERKNHFVNEFRKKPLYKRIYVKHCLDITSNITLLFNKDFEIFTLM